MFGIALGIDIKDFKQVSQNPKSVLLGTISQFLILPALTALLVFLFNPHPALGLGMILVAACPGGNVSNFISSVSNANIALSVSLTAIATILTPFLTPFNFDFWASFFPETNDYLQTFDLSFLSILKTVVLLLVIPLFSGMVVKKKLPLLASKIEKPIRILSFIILVGFIVGALSNNFEIFKKHLSLVFVLVLIHNSIALISGYIMAYLGQVPEPDKRTISIETGIQNSGLGLIIIFTFFDGNGGMAIIAAWWGVWHIISGFSLALWYKHKDKRKVFPKTS